MNLADKYLSGMFSTDYFAETATIQNGLVSINFLRVDEDMNVSFDRFSYTGSNNNLILKSSDVFIHNIKLEDEITIKSEVFIIKEFKKNADGTTTIKVEQK